ncbi:hypothetical protein JDV52_24095 [Escherichia coli]|nr:hypothetical protein [Escherichia coli]
MTNTTFMAVLTELTCRGNVVTSWFASVDILHALKDVDSYYVQAVA